MQRICEPELMDDAQQAEAYAEADFSDSDQAMVDAIMDRIERLDAPPRNLMDLGCGPGNLSFRLADALPNCPLLAVDGAAAMLAPALRLQRSDLQRWPLLRFQQACLPLIDGDLSSLGEPFQPPFSVLVSNSLLHHLHDPDVLWSTLCRFGGPASLVVIRDLRRPDDPFLLEALVQRHASGCPPILQRDYRASLQAAFRPEEVEEQLRRAGLHSLTVRPLEDRYLEVTGQLD